MAECEKEVRLHSGTIVYKMIVVVTASYIVLSGAPNLHFLSFHLLTLRLSYLSPHTLWIITYVNSLSVTSF